MIANEHEFGENDKMFKYSMYCSRGLRNVPMYSWSIVFQSKIQWTWKSGNRPQRNQIRFHFGRLAAMSKRCTICAVCSVRCEYKWWFSFIFRFSFAIEQSTTKQSRIHSFKKLQKYLAARKRKINRCLPNGIELGCRWRSFHLYSASLSFAKFSFHNWRLFETFYQ